jgi:hypothetical protein
VSVRMFDLCGTLSPNKVLLHPCLESAGSCQVLVTNEEWGPPDARAAIHEKEVVRSQGSGTKR